MTKKIMSNEKCRVDIINHVVKICVCPIIPEIKKEPKLREQSCAKLSYSRASYDRCANCFIAFLVKI